MRILFRKLGPSRLVLPDYPGPVGLMHRQHFRHHQRDLRQRRAQGRARSTVEIHHRRLCVYLALALSRRTSWLVQHFSDSLRHRRLPAHRLLHSAPRQEDHGAKSWISIGPSASSRPNSPNSPSFSAWHGSCACGKTASRISRPSSSRGASRPFPFSWCSNSPPWARPLFFSPSASRCSGRRARGRITSHPAALVASVVVMSYYWIHVWDKPVPFLKHFQTARIQIFFDPSLDPRRGLAGRPGHDRPRFRRHGWQGLAQGWRRNWAICRRIRVIMI